MRISERINTILEIAMHPSNNGNKISALFKYLRWNIGHRIMAAEYILHLVDNAYIILSERQNYSTLIYTCGLWDFQEQAFLIHFLRQTEIFVDIGSNVGGYSIIASKVVGAKSIAFEPVPDTYIELKRNIRLNNIELNVQTHCCALGELDGTNYMTKNLGGLNHIVDGSSHVDAIQVATSRLDTILSEINCHVMKLDAEGFELQILRGGEKTITNPSLQAIIIELNGSGDRYGTSDDDVHLKISSYGFSPCTYDARNRSLKPILGYNKNGLNTIYVRDITYVQDKLFGGRSFTLRNITF